MLKHEGQWEALTDKERLFLIAMAYELPRISGLDVLHADIAYNAGLDKVEFARVAYTLESKGLIRVDGGHPLMFRFGGDAVTRCLCLGKHHSLEKAEAQTSKYPYHMRMPEPHGMVS